MQQFDTTTEGATTDGKGSLKDVVMQAITEAGDNKRVTTAWNWVRAWDAVGDVAYLLAWGVLLATVGRDIEVATGNILFACAISAGLFVCGVYASWRKSKAYSRWSAILTAQVASDVAQWAYAEGLADIESVAESMQMKQVAEMHAAHSSVWN